MIKRLLLVLLALVLALVALLATQIRRDVPVEELRAAYANEASRFMEMDGMAVHYRDEGAGPALVLLHGTSSSLHTWDGWTAALQDSFRVIRLDLPGFGLTGPHPAHDYRVETYVTFLRDFLGRLGVERFSLAGNSLGGFIAWRYALVYPDHLDRLVLIDPAGYPSDREPPLAFKLAQMPVLNRLLPLTLSRSLVAGSLRDVYADDARVTPALVQRYYDLSLREGNRAAFVARANTPEVNRFDEMDRITTPTLILWGAHDVWSPAEYAPFFAEKLPRDTLIVYPDAGHVPMEEIPERTAADARRFLLQELPR